MLPLALPANAAGFAPGFAVDASRQFQRAGGLRLPSHVDRSVVPYQPGPGGVPEFLVYETTPDGGEYMVALGPHAPHAAGSLDGLGFIHGKIWGGIKSAGGAVWGAVKKGSKDPSTREAIQAWLASRGGASAVAGGACVLDPACGGHYILDASTSTAVVWRRASTGECLGRDIINAATIQGWDSPCRSGSGYYPIGSGAGAQYQGDAVGQFLERNQNTILLAGGGVVFLILATSIIKAIGGRKRR